MFFSKKKKYSERCENCNRKLEKKYNYCPHCGELLVEDKEEYGLLGKSDKLNENLLLNGNGIANFGFTDKIIGSIINNLVKTLDKQFKQIDKETEKTEIQTFPNGIKIRIGPPVRNQSNLQQVAPPKRKISEEQISKMSSLPRSEAKTKIKRINDRIIYELSTPGIKSTEDIFISKLESGYEIKAIADKKIYVNSLSVNLPLKSLQIDNNKLFIEFNAKPNNFF